jgi:uncharacterized protein YaaN involved in tellurite resistance
MQVDTDTGTWLPALANQFPEENKINLAQFAGSQRQRIEEIIKRHSQLDSEMVMRFGIEPQQEINRQLDELLQGIKTNDAGVAGQLTLELAKNIKSMNLPRLKRESLSQDWFTATIGQLPVVGKWASALRYFQLMHKEIVKHLAQIEAKAQKEIVRLNTTNQKLDRLAEKTLLALEEMELFLAAGQAILIRAKGHFESEKKRLAQSADMLAMTRLRDAAELIDAFEARLMRIHVAYSDAFISVPQIRLTQQAGRIEIHNIMDTVQFDIPRLKSAIIRVAALNQITQASKANAARIAITRQVGSIGADALDAAYTRAKQSQGSAAEDIAMLAETADKLLATIAKGAAISEDNRRKFSEAGLQLTDLRSKFSSAMDAAVTNVTDVTHLTNP